MTTPSNGLTIAEVERDCGLGADTLRVWERRYGFPRPERDARGARFYPQDQVETLRVLSRLIAAGRRPSQIVGLSLEALRELPAVSPRRGAPRLAPSPPEPQDIRAALDVLKAHDSAGFAELLTRRMVHDGLAAFVLNFVAPLVMAVGEEWARGDLEIFEEHLATEELTRVLRQGVRSAASPDGGRGGRPKILLTTAPGERHTLGLLMAEAMMVLAGCRCVALGAETPIKDMLAAADAHEADVIALSFSAHCAPRAVREALSSLTAARPRPEIWVGGVQAGVLRSEHGPVQPLGGLGAIAAEVEAWRLRHGL